jgi:allantoin racemase
MHIRIINPNTTAAFTQRCVAGAQEGAAAGTRMTGGTSAFGVESVECHADEALATAAVIEQIRQGEREGVQGYVIACFGDTGLDAARELAKGPVVGMSEAALYAAALIAPVFSIITLPLRTRIFAERVLWHAGLERRSPRVRAIDVPVLDCEDSPTALLEPLLAESRRAIAEDHAEAIILGCAGLQPLVGPASASLGVPVIEGVAAAVKQVEGLLSLGLTTSKRGQWAAPPRPLPTLKPGA